VGRLRAALTTFPDLDLEALLVAIVGDTAFLVDGHHRLDAYRLAGRATVPIRAIATTRDDAVQASKLVNCGGEKLPMHSEQYRDAAWQYLANATRQGKAPLPKGESCRSVAARFGGISPDTVSRMLRRLPSVDLSEFADAACDPATGWPRWRHVRGNAWRDCFNEVSPAARTQDQAERLAKQLGALQERHSPEVFQMAIELLLADSRDDSEDAKEALSQWAEITADY